MGVKRARALESPSTYILLSLISLLCGLLDGLVCLGGFHNMPEGWCKASRGLGVYGNGGYSQISGYPSFTLGGVDPGLG
jgi:hypothetical protein